MPKFADRASYQLPRLIDDHGRVGRPKMQESSNTRPIALKFALVVRKRPEPKRPSSAFDRNSRTNPEATRQGASGRASHRTKDLARNPETSEGPRTENHPLARRSGPGLKISAMACNALTISDVLRRSHQDDARDTATPDLPLTSAKVGVEWPISVRYATAAQP